VPRGAALCRIGRRQGAPVRVKGEILQGIHTGRGIIKSMQRVMGNRSHVGEKVLGGKVRSSKHKGSQLKEKHLALQGWDGEHARKKGP